jgi:hypothetical protein
MIPVSALEVADVPAAVSLMAASAATDGEVGDWACRCSPLEQETRTASDERSEAETVRRLRRRLGACMMVITTVSSDERAS